MLKVIAFDPRGEGPYHKQRTAPRRIEAFVSRDWLADSIKRPADSLARTHRKAHF